MKNKITWEGIYPAVLTPFKENGDIDYNMFLKNMNAQVDAGVEGFVIAGTLGEASTLSNKEKFDLVKFAKDKLSSEIPIIVNIAESSTKNAIKFAQNSEEIGADGLMLLPPLMYKASDEEVVAFFSAVAESMSLSILIYNNPVDYGIQVTMDMFAQLTKYDNVQAAKESTRDLTNVTRMINRFGNRYKILGGVDTIALETILLGGHGSIAGLVNAFPKETVAYFKLAEKGRLDEALDIYRWFMPLLELDIVPKLVQNIKLAATAEGIGRPHVRAPRLPLKGEEKKQVQKIIDGSIESRPDLSKYNLQ